MMLVGLNFSVSHHTLFAKAVLLQAKTTQEIFVARLLWQLLYLYPVADFANRSHTARNFLVLANVF